LERLLVVFGVDIVPQVFDDCATEPDALLQSMPLALVFCVLYDGVTVEDVILFMLNAGLDCCCGGANDGLPIPGLLGAIAGNEEFRVLKVLSGVMARLCDLGALNDVLLGGGRGVTGGVDQENVAAGDALLDVLERLLEG
jgi:hypothetical protein